MFNFTKDRTVASVILLGRNFQCEAPGKEYSMKYNTEQLCEKIRQVFPDVGECGIDIKRA